MTESTSSSKSAFAATDRPSVGGAYALRDLSAVVQRFHRSRDATWLSIARSIAAGLGVEAPIAPDVRPEATARPFPAATVFLLGATSGETPGCIGHVSARPSAWSIGGAGAGESVATIRGGAEIADTVVQRIVEAVRGLSPDAVRPETELVVPTNGEGDSHALAVAIAAMHALLRCGVPPGLAATGGFDAGADGGHPRFRSVPIETLPAKLAAATRWGVRILVVVEDQPLPDDLPPDLRIVRVAHDPGALPLLVLQLASEGAAARDATEAWRKALALYDLRVASRRGEPIESVWSVTAPFVDPVVEGLDRVTPPSPEAVREAVVRRGLDPVVVGLAADIRSRVLLHAGRSVESAWWDAIAVGLRGQGDLPDGLLGDHILLRQPSHRSILALDLGALDDPLPSDPRRESHPHVVLDRSIEDLERRWRTRHQTLLGIFATNSRWRRQLYLARRDLDRSRFDAATTDLLRWRSRWEDLLDDHARLGLRMGDTDLSRQWNYVLEHAVTDVSLRDPDGFSRGGGDIEVRRQVAAAWHADEGLLADLQARLASSEPLKAFDLRGLLQWLWVSVETAVPPAVGDRCREILLDGRDFAAVGVAEWWWRLLDADSPDRRLVHDTFRRVIEPHIGAEAAADDGRPTGIPRVVALRRAAILDLDGVPSAPGSSWVESVAPPAGPASLRAMFEDLRSRPGRILLRTPY